MQASATKKCKRFECKRDPANDSRPTNIMQTKEHRETNPGKNHGFYQTLDDQGKNQGKKQGFLLPGLNLRFKPAGFNQAVRQPKFGETPKQNSKHNIYEPRRIESFLF